jgi:hypothetical protein
VINHYHHSQTKKSLLELAVVPQNILNAQKGMQRTVILGLSILPASNHPEDDQCSKPTSAQNLTQGIQNVSTGVLSLPHGPLHEILKPGDRSPWGCTSGVETLRCVLHINMFPFDGQTRERGLIRCAI